MRRALIPHRPILYSFRRCPYAMRARLALAIAALDYEMREVDLRAKPAALLAASPKGTVPVLVLADGAIIDQSLAIMAWALRQEATAAWLPRDPDELARSNALIASNDTAFKFHLDRMKYAVRYPGVDPAQHRQQAVEQLAVWEQALTRRAYLGADRPMLVDLALMPFVRQFAHVDQGAFMALPLPRLQQWLEAWCTSPWWHQAMVRSAVWQEECAADGQA